MQDNYYKQLDEMSMDEELKERIVANLINITHTPVVWNTMSYEERDNVAAALKYYALINAKRLLNEYTEDESKEKIPVKKYI